MPGKNKESRENLMLDGRAPIPTFRDYLLIKCIFILATYLAHRMLLHFSALTVLQSRISVRISFRICIIKNSEYLKVRNKTALILNA